MPKASEIIQPIKLNMLTMVGMRTKIFKKYMSVQGYQKNTKTRTHETKWSHQRIIDENKVAQKNQDTN